MFTTVALRYQAYDISESTFVVGLLGLTQLVPLLIAAIGFGQIADVFDKKRVLLMTQLVLAAMSATLALNAASGSPKLWVLFVLAACQSFVLGIDWPTRSALVPRLVGESLMTPAVALNMVAFSVMAVVGPIGAGEIVARSIPLAYGLDSASYLLFFVALAGLRPQPASAALKIGFGAITDGLKYVRSNRLLQSTFVADIGAMVFGVPDALFPAMAVEVFGGGPRTFGLLQAAPGVGALISAAFSGWTSRVRRAGWAIIWAIVVWGAAIVVFGMTDKLPIALVALAVAGGADGVSAIFPLVAGRGQHTRRIPRSALGDLRCGGTRRSACRRVRVRGREFTRRAPVRSMDRRAGRPRSDRAHRLAVPGTAQLHVGAGVGAFAAALIRGRL